MIIKPQKLFRGSKLAIVSPSWAGPYEYPHRYKTGKYQLQKAFDFELIDMPNTLKSPEYLENNPKARTEDIIQALEDKSIDGIIASIGGDDSVRILKYINEDVIKNNPKSFMGYSDSTSIHCLFYKAGVMSFYSPSIMAGFAENNGISDYLIENFGKVIMSSEIIGEIKPNKIGYSIDNPSWDLESNQNIPSKIYNEPMGTMILNGKYDAEGILYGGCIDTLESIKGTEYWLDDWKNIIFFIETSEDTPNIEMFKRWLRNYGEQGIFDKISGIIFGRHVGTIEQQKAYNKALVDVVVNEYNKKDLLIFGNMDFGHTRPIFTIPYGCKAKMNIKDKSFSILDNAVINN